MHPKTQTYIDLAQSAARQITSNYRSWTGFLITASRLYKYSYADQLLIHAQRPEATACAEYDLWNNIMHRYIRRGAKGIALLDIRAGQVGLRHVFDVADTGTRQQSRTPFVWSVNEHNSLAISALLEYEYAASSEHGLSHQLDEIARTQAKSYWQDHRYDSSECSLLSSFPGIAQFPYFVLLALSSMRFVRLDTVDKLCYNMTTPRRCSHVSEHFNSSIQGTAE